MFSQEQQSQMPRGKIIFNNKKKYFYKSNIINIRYDKNDFSENWDYCDLLAEGGYDWTHGLKNV